MLFPNCDTVYRKLLYAQQKHPTHMVLLITSNQKKRQETYKILVMINASYINHIAWRNKETDVMFKTN